MKRIQIILLAIMLLILLLLAGCSSGAPGTAPSATTAAAASAASAASSASSAATASDEIWTKEEMPVSLRYDRIWVYSAYAETKDPEIMKELVETIRALEIGEESEWITEDYTDILTFTFANGEKVRLEFENQSWVREDGKRLEVSGLEQVRAILEMILPDAG